MDVPCPSGCSDPVTGLPGCNIRALNRSLNFRRRAEQDGRMGLPFSGPLWRGPLRFPVQSHPPFTKRGVFVQLLFVQTPARKPRPSLQADDVREAENRCPDRTVPSVRLPVDEDAPLRRWRPTFAPNGCSCFDSLPTWRSILFVIPSWISQDLPSASIVRIPPSGWVGSPVLPRPAALAPRQGKSNLGRNVVTSRRLRPAQICREGKKNKKKIKESPRRRGAAGGEGGGWRLDATRSGLPHDQHSVGTVDLIAQSPVRRRMTR